MTPPPADAEDAAPSPAPPARLLAVIDSAPTANPRLPAHLERLADRARHYAEAASSANTRLAYDKDWRHYTTWCQNLPPLPPEPQVVGLYITACAPGAATADRKPNSVATIERRLSAL